MEAVLLPSLIGSGEKIVVYLEPVPLNSESEPPLTLISARVKSEDLGEFKLNESSHQRSAWKKFEWSGVRWRCNGEGENYCCHSSN